jgi:hypothetical protein
MESASTPFLSKDEKSESYAEKGHYGDDADHVPEPGQRRGRGRLAAWNIMTCLLAGWGLIALGTQVFQVLFPSTSLEADVYRPETLSPGLNLCECGQTTEEALSRHCIYDPLSTAWLPPHCRDDELTAEFEESGPGPQGHWDYFADENGTIPLSKGDIAALGPAGGAFWTSRDWHIAHCLFYWLKYKRMRSTGAVMEARFDNIKHIKHCSHLARTPAPDYFFLIEVPVRMNGSVDPRTSKISANLPHIPS